MFESSSRVFLPDTWGEPGSAMSAHTPVTLRFTLRQLQYFIVVAESRSISEASRRIHIAQTAIASAISKIEDQLGIDLFVRRHAQGITLTVAGQRLLRMARDLVQCADKFQRSAVSYQASSGGLLTLGAADILTGVCLTELLKAYSKFHPGVTVTISEQKEGQLLADVQSGNLEAALVPQPKVLPNDVEFTPIDTFVPWVLTCSGSEFAMQRQLDADAISTSVIHLLSDTPEKEQLISELLVAGANLGRILPVGSLDAARALVESGLGIAIVLASARSCPSALGRNLAARRLAASSVSVSVGLLYPRAVRLAKTVRDLLMSVDQRALSLNGNTNPALRAV